MIKKHKQHSLMDYFTGTISEILGDRSITRWVRLRVLGYSSIADGLGKPDIPFEVMCEIEDFVDDQT